MRRKQTLHFTNGLQVKKSWNVISRHLTVRSRTISPLPLTNRFTLNRDRVDQRNCQRDRSPSFVIHIDETKDHVDASTSTGTELKQPIVVQTKIQFVCS
ncbi:hypothetical protein Bpfe_008953 [Biomphalaria pfeifferi]|uniref:Uncharacterized protein n=1 Tax=Biomphalaria pfeifferi TaxID=112525 RepID=A0AAD8BVE9_BIOPF|nr:hypothetical protein Bpfe_008953 [Biomphalaria pfeifferi]